MTLWLGQGEVHPLAWCLDLSSITVGWISEDPLVDLGLNWGPQSQEQHEGNHKTTRQEGENTLRVEGRRERVPYGIASNWHFKPPGHVWALKCQVNFKKSGLVKIFKEHKGLSQWALVFRTIKRSASYKWWPISKRSYFFLIVLIFPVLKSPLTKEICLLRTWKLVVFVLLLQQLK